MPLISDLTVEPGTSILVLEGEIRVNDNGAPLIAKNMNHVKPRPYPLILGGNAKIWLIRHKTPAHGVDSAAARQPVQAAPQPALSI
jgi:hypothetical protein